MHRLHSNAAIYRLRIAALLVCFKCVMAPVAAGLLCYALIIHDQKLTLMAVGLVLLTAFFAILQWIVAARTSCPLCMTPVLAKKGCTKHRHARTFLGSHRLRVALTILLKNSFRCPYCNEPTLLEVRRSGRH
jgi:hypothetical protein